MLKLKINSLLDTLKEGARHRYSAKFNQLKSTFPIEFSPSHEILEPELLEPLINDDEPEWFIRFSNSEKEFISPKLSHSPSYNRTPFGYYAYPITTEIVDEFKTNTIKYMGDAKYIYLFHISSDDIFYFKKNDSGVTASAPHLLEFLVEKLIDELSTLIQRKTQNNQNKTKQLEDNVLKELSFAEELANKHTNLTVLESVKILYNLCKKLGGVFRSTQLFSWFLTKLNFKVIADLGTSIIHRNEPSQIVVLPGYYNKIVKFQIFNNPHSTNVKSQINKAHINQKKSNTQSILLKIQKKLWPNKEFVIKLNENKFVFHKTKTNLKIKKELVFYYSGVDVRKIIKEIISNVEFKDSFFFDNFFKLRKELQSFNSEEIHKIIEFINEMALYIPIQVSTDNIFKLAETNQLNDLLIDFFLSEELLIKVNESFNKISNFIKNNLDYLLYKPEYFIENTGPAIQFNTNILQLINEYQANNTLVKKEKFKVKNKFSNQSLNFHNRYSLLAIFSPPRDEVFALNVIKYFTLKSPYSSKTLNFEKIFSEISIIKEKLEQKNITIEEYVVLFIDSFEIILQYLTIFATTIQEIKKQLFKTLEMPIEKVFQEKYFVSPDDKIQFKNLEFLLKEINNNEPKTNVSINTNIMYEDFAMNNHRGQVTVDFQVFLNFVSDFLKKEISSIKFEDFYKIFQNNDSFDIFRQAYFEKYLKVSKEFYLNGDLKNIKHFNIEGKLHGDLFRYSLNGNLSQKETYYNGLLNDINGKASKIKWYENGQKQYEEYYIGGKLHNEKGPASVWWDENGKKKSEYFYLNGTELSKEQWKQERQKSSIQADDRFSNLEIDDVDDLTEIPRSNQVKPKEVPKKPMLDLDENKNVLLESKFYTDAKSFVSILFNSIVSKVSKKDSMVISALPNILNGVLPITITKKNQSAQPILEKYKIKHVKFIFNPYEKYNQNINGGFNSNTQEIQIHIPSEGISQKNFVKFMSLIYKKISVIVLHELVHARQFSTDVTTISRKKNSDFGNGPKTSQLSNVEGDTKEVNNIFSKILANSKLNKNFNDKIFSIFVSNYDEIKKNIFDYIRTYLMDIEIEAYSRDIIKYLKITKSKDTIKQMLKRSKDQLTTYLKDFLIKILKDFENSHDAYKKLKESITIFYENMFNMKEIKINYYIKNFLNYKDSEETQNTQNNDFLELDESLSEGYQLMWEDDALEFGDPYEIATIGNIHISRDKDFLCGHVKDDTLCSALFTSLDTASDDDGNYIGVYYFNIATHPNHQGKGLASDLVKVAMKQYQDLKSEGLAQMCIVDVVNPSMKKILEKFNFIVTVDWGNRWMMTYKESLPGNA